jgi:hypothetical protein
MQNPKTINNAIAIRLAVLDEVSKYKQPGGYALWREVTCRCGEGFNLYGSVIYSRRDMEQQYVNDLLDHLKKEDAKGQGHRDVYDLHFLDVPVDYKTEL